MKKKGGIGRIFAVLLLLFAVCVFAVFASGTKIAFIENYTYNFKMNMLALTRMFNIQLSEPIEEFLQDLSTPEPSEEPQQEESDSQDAGTQTGSEIEDVEDIPEVEFTEQKLENKEAVGTPVALTNAASAKYAKYRDYILCVSETRIIAYDNSGRELWTVGIHMSNPILSVNGNYYMVAEGGGRKISLFDGKNKIYEAEADGSIKNASVSANADVAVVSEKENYKGAVIVINKNGDRVFSWNSGSDSVIDADIAAASRQLAVSLLNTEGGAKSRVLLFDISKGENQYEQEFNDAIVFDVDYLGEVLNVFADNKVCGMSQKGKILWELEYTQRQLIRYSVDDNGYKILLSDNSNTPQIEVITGRGKQKSVISPDVLPDCLNINSGVIAYNKDRDIILSNVSGKQQKVYSCTREIRDVYIIDSDHVVVVYNSGLDFIKFI